SAGNRANIGDIVGAIEGDGAGIRDIAGNAATGAAIADLQSTCADGGRTRVRIHSCIGERTRALFRDCAVAGNDSVKGGAVRAIEDERTVIRYVARDGATGAAVADLQLAGADGGAA